MLKQQNYFCENFDDKAEFCMHDTEYCQVGYGVSKSQMHD